MRRAFLLVLLLVLSAPRPHVALAHAHEFDTDATVGHVHFAAFASDHAHHDAGDLDERFDGAPPESHVHVDTGGHASTALARAPIALVLVGAHRPGEPRPAFAPDPPPLPLLRPPATH